MISLLGVKSRYIGHIEIPPFKTEFHSWKFDPRVKLLPKKNPTIFTEYTDYYIDKLKGIISDFTGL